MKYTNPAPLKSEGFQTPEMKRIYTMMLKYIKLPCKTFHDWDARPRCGYLFGGDGYYGSDQNRTLGLLAFLSKYGDFDEALAEFSRSEIKEMAIRILRYSCFTHDTGPSDCVRPDNGGPTAGLKWGGNDLVLPPNPKHRFFEGTQVGSGIVYFALAAWFLWDDLEEETRQMSYDVITDYAERWCDCESRSGTYYDTQADENSWTANGIYAAAAIFKDDPRAEKWRESAIRWMLDAATVSLDMQSDEKLSDGVPLRKRINNITFHPDYTTENHAIVHPDYMIIPLQFRVMMNTFSMLSGADELPGLRHNWQNLYNNVFLPCSTEDGYFVPVQTQDWFYYKLYAFICVHAATRFLFDDEKAAYLEELCINTLEKTQAGHPEGSFTVEDPEKFNVDGVQSMLSFERDICPYMIWVYMWHFCLGEGVKPVSRKTYEEQNATVRHYPFGGSVIQRTPDAFSVFSYRNSANAAVLPDDKVWTVTVPPCSTFGEMIFSDGCEENPGLSNQTVIRSCENIYTHVKTDSYASSVCVDRGLGSVSQDVSFVSMPDGRSVYFQRVRAKKECSIEKFTSGLVGIRNEYYKYLPEYAKGYRMLYIDSEAPRKMVGQIGGADVIYDYKNVQVAAIDDKMAYLLHGSNSVRYISHRDYPKWKGVEDFLVLNSYENIRMKAGEKLPLFVAVYLPNCNIEKAHSMNEAFCVSCSGSADAVMLEDKLIFSSGMACDGITDASFELPPGKLPLFEGVVSYKDGLYTWSSSVRAGECGYKTAVTTISPNRDFEAVILPDKMVLIRYDGEADYKPLA